MYMGVCVWEGGMLRCVCACVSEYVGECSEHVSVGVVCVGGMFIVLCLREQCTTFMSEHISLIAVWCACITVRRCMGMH